MSFIPASLEIIGVTLLAPPLVGLSLTEAAMMGAVVHCAYQGLTALGMNSRLILCALPVVVGVCVYAFAAVKLKAITRADCLLLPKGAKIAKLLKL